MNTKHLIWTSKNYIFDELAYPHLYPYGTGGLHEERLRKINAKIYYKTLLMLEDRGFASDTSFIFSAYTRCLKGDIQTQISTIFYRGTIKDYNGPIWWWYIYIVSGPNLT